MKKALSLLVFLAAFGSAMPARADAPAPASPVATGDGFVILPGDVLQITVWKEEGLDREVLVLPDGSISFPLIGSLEAKGRTLEGLQGLVKAKLKNYIPDASVTVSVKAALGHTVNVIGQVNKPGEIVISQRLTAMQALAQAGGLTPFASEGGIIVIRQKEGGGEISLPIPYDDLVDGESLDKDIMLQPGDVIVVPTAGLF